MSEEKGDGVHFPHSPLSTSPLPNTTTTTQLASEEAPGEAGDWSVHLDWKSGSLLPKNLFPSKPNDKWAIDLLFTIRGAQRPRSAHDGPHNSRSLKGLPLLLTDSSLGVSTAFVLWTRTQGSIFFFLLVPKLPKKKKKPTHDWSGRRLPGLMSLSWILTFCFSDRSYCPVQTKNAELKSTTTSLQHDFDLCQAKGQSKDHHISNASAANSACENASCMTFSGSYFFCASF